MQRSNFLLLICVAILFGLGLIMIFNTTSAEVLDKSLNVDTHLALWKQTLFGLLGICIGYAIYRFGYSSFIDLSPLMLFLCCVLLVLVFIPGIGQEINGAKRWIGFFSYITLQPSEFAKYLIPIYFIYRVTKKKPKTYLEFIKLLLIFLVPLLLILLEPDNGTTAMILFMLVVLFFLTKIRMVFWAVPLIIVLVMGGGIAYSMPHVKHRIKAYLHPEMDVKGKGHQPYQAKIAAGSGKIFGKGLGESMQKLNYLPLARSDYIAAIYAEEFGFVGICILICLYMLIAYKGFAIAAIAKDKSGFYIAAIMTFMICFQAFINLGVVSGLLPSKGITLPFFSQGGTSLVIHFMTIGLLLSVNKSKKMVSKTA